MMTMMMVMMMMSMMMMMTMMMMRRRRTFTWEGVHVEQKIWSWSQACKDSC